MKIVNNPFVKMNNDQITIERMVLYNSIRKEWDRLPMTKIKKSKKIYNRKELKQTKEEL